MYVKFFMIKNYISANIQFLINKLNCSQDEFGNLFGLNRGNINQYLKEKAQPKIETLQKMALHFGITLDNLVSIQITDNILSEVKEPSATYENESSKYVALLEKSLEDKDKIIHALELQLGNDVEKNRGKTSAG